MKLPDLSHLQIAVLGIVGRGEHSGRDIRGHLDGLNVRQTGPAFYQMMARLEDAGLVEGWYTQQIVAGQIIKERHYRPTAAGRKAWRMAHAFYRSTFSAVHDAPAHA